MTKYCLLAFCLLVDYNCITVAESFLFFNDMVCLLQMFGTLAYCLGFTSNGLTPSDKSKGLSFRTEELNDDWTLVDLNDQSCGRIMQNIYVAAIVHLLIKHLYDMLKVGNLQ